MKKTKQCLEICDNLGEIDDQTIDAIFGNANASLSDDLVKLKSICEERIINRQKSTGCHVSSSDSLSIYKKIAGQGNQISAEDETDFYENNMDSKDFET